MVEITSKGQACHLCGAGDSPENPIILDLELGEWSCQQCAGTDYSDYEEWDISERECLGDSE